MCYRVEFTLPDGTVRYLDARSRETAEPYHWHSRSAAMNIVKTIRRAKSVKKRNYVVVDEELEKIQKNINTETPVKVFTAEASRKKKTLETLEKIKQMSRAFEGDLTDSEIQKTLGISPATITRYKKMIREETVEDKQPALTDTRIQTLGDACRILCSEVSNLQEKIKAETDNIAREDRVTQDILHYIELTECSETMAVQLIGMLKKSRKRRRESKDAVMLLSAIRDNISPQTAESICNAADALIDRSYSPRELQELFK